MYENYCVKLTLGAIAEVYVENTLFKPLLKKGSLQCSKTLLIVQL